LDKNLTGAQLRLYSLILHLSITEGFCWASTETLAKMLGTTVRRIGQLLLALEESKYITRFNQTEESIMGRKIMGRRIYPQVVVEWVEQNGHEGNKKAARKKSVNKEETKSFFKGNPGTDNKEVSSSKEEEETRKSNKNSSYVVSSSLQEETPKAVSAELQERNTSSSQPAGFTTSVSGNDKRVLAETDNKYNFATWNDYIRNKYGPGFRESEEYLKMAKILK
jgi:hypothetical protein